ncbi:MAG: cytochrome c biogenesis protein CcsA [SAR324 cluster bacterium]|nr:cytochrome c biogenesis protein CcsA [SAR324 cluster bacterium]
MMLADIGYILMTGALAVSIYGMVVPHVGVVRNNWNLVRSAQFAAILNFLLILGASAVLLRSFLRDDFSVVFVWEHSSTDLPLFYKISAFWGGMEGSLLFWVLILAGFSAVVAYGYQRTNREIIPYVIATLSAIHVFLLGLLVTWSNPLATQAPIPLEGRGLNPLLQHPAMAIHPPLLYLGYIGFSVPFAFAIASLVRGKLDNAWVVTTRRWTLGAWYALLVGQMLGGQWAYEELGWGGYWGWDPVENAALMPWLTGTAFLHSVILQEKRNMMKVWNMVLIIVTFGLSIMGTFIVRSGVLNSVHAFAQSEVGPAFLAYLALVLVVAFSLLFWRIRLLESRHTADSLLSRESAFLLNNLLFMGIAFTVFLGTVFPLLAEAIRGTKLSIQAPFFNTITAPLGIALLFLIGIATLIAWRHSSWDYLVRNFRLPVALALLTALAGGGDVASTILYHHERPDGEGYYGLDADSTPVAARVLALAEVYDAMTSCRLTAPLPSERALDQLTEWKGESVDSDCVDALVDRLRVTPKTIPLAPLPY